MYDFASIVSEIRLDASGPLRLRDLVAALRSGELSAQSITDRLSPDLADEVAAVALHRGVSVETLIVGALLNFALDAADEAWRRLEERRAEPAGDGEARAFAVLLSGAVRRALDRDPRIAAPSGVEKISDFHGRRVAGD
ncbi:hypothetical protein [Methylocella sp.]|uniref:hypothetical protein n=1 Tax=Methylocella sp. TaxID=1978226 RepID=UPI0037836219